MNLWGLQPGSGVWLGGHATDGKRRLHHLLDDMPRPPVGPIEAGFVTSENVDEAIHFAQKLSTRLGPGKRLWVLIPSVPDSEANPWHSLDDRMFDLGFTRIALIDIDDHYQTVGYEHTSLA